MRNSDLPKDYVKRSLARLEALKVLFEKESYADVVRESQEIIELCGKALVRMVGGEPARVHDVSTQLSELLSRFPASLQESVKAVGKASRELRRDRELSFYGSEDLTPSEFYKKEDAEEAMRQALATVGTSEKVLKATQQT